MSGETKGFIVAGQFLKNEFMKVICIDATMGKCTGCKPPFKEGEILTACESPVYSYAYQILEYPKNAKGKPHYWSKARFIPLSEIDETEMIREYNTVTKT